jgi:hypothetical protein
VPPSFDYDNQGRPAGTGFDIGADELPGGPPTLPFPATGILDNFNRADGNLGSSWTYNFTTPPPVTRVRVNSLQAQVIGLGGAFYWNPTVFGNRQEAYLTFQKVVSTATEQALLLKLAGSPNPNAAAASLIEVNYQAASGLVQVRTKDSSQGWVIRANFPATFAPGDVFGARTLQTGITTVYKNGVLIGSVDLSTGAQPWPAARITGGGRIGVWFLAPSFALPNDARFDDFGGGNVP